MISLDEHNAYEFTRSEEALEARNEGIIERWKASKTIDMLAAIAADLGDLELLTIDTLRMVRLDVERLAAERHDQIIRAWEAAHDGDNEAGGG